MPLNDCAWQPHKDDSEVSQVSHSGGKAGCKSDEEAEAQRLDNASQVTELSSCRAETSQ